MSVTRPSASAAFARTFLFLQGPSSFLFQWIASELEALGHDVLRINFCAGDRVFWRRGNAINFTGRSDQWPAFVRRLIVERRITDMVLLGEERPLHRVAISEADLWGVSVSVIEMGYLRPDWISIERDGAGSNSRFPDDPGEIVEAAKHLPSPDFMIRFRHSFLSEVLHDLAFNLPNVFLPFLHPHYRRHALRHPIVEYWGWIRRVLGSSEQKRRTASALSSIGERGFFLYPLQLETDYQLRAHSPFNSQEEAIRDVLEAFASAASVDTHLLLKTHPLDNGLTDWGAIVAKLSSRLGIGARVHLAYRGDLALFIRDCAGVVTINSTVGIQALMAGKPVSVMGTAIYDIETLTDRRTLGDFFRRPSRPDPLVRDSFLALLAESLHERGSFYSFPAARDAAKAVARRLHESRVNLPGALKRDPPRRRPTKRIPR